MTLARKAKREARHSIRGKLPFSDDHPGTWEPLQITPAVRNRIEREAARIRKEIKKAGGE